MQFSIILRIFIFWRGGEGVMVLLICRGIQSEYSKFQWPICILDSTTSSFQVLLKFSFHSPNVGLIVTSWLFLMLLQWGSHCCFIYLFIFKSVYKSFNFFFPEPRLRQIWPLYQRGHFHWFQYDLESSMIFYHHLTSNVHKSFIISRLSNFLLCNNSKSEKIMNF